MTCPNLSPIIPITASVSPDETHRTPLYHWLNTFHTGKRLLKIDDPNNDRLENAAFEVVRHKPLTLYVRYAPDGDPTPIALSFQGKLLDLTNAPELDRESFLTSLKKALTFWRKP